MSAPDSGLACPPEQTAHSGFIAAPGCVFYSGRAPLTHVLASCLMRIPGAAVVAAVVTKTGGWGLPDTFELEHPNRSSIPSRRHSDAERHRSVQLVPPAPRL